MFYGIRLGWAVGIIVALLAGCGNGRTSGGDTGSDGGGGDTGRLEASADAPASDGSADVSADVSAACTPNPCMNGGSCTGTGTSYTCVCAAGYSGANCETNINDCMPNPCMNGGTCTDGINRHTCACPAGYTGANCETNIDDCAPNPCQNGGTCTDGVNMYTCACATGFSGTSCETNINDCLPDPCMNGGTCVDGIATHTCMCPTGFSGANCETNINDCLPNPCMNGGTCIDGVAAFTCNCPSGFTGATCATAAVSCTPNPCLNAGTCSVTSGGYACACATGFSGSNCGVNINDCAPNPCMNGGTCVDGVASHTCTCTGGYTGANCEVAPAQFCDVLYAIGGGTCAAPTNTGRFHSIKTGLGAMNTYFNVGTNCSSPRRGTGGGTAVASPFTPTAFPRGYVRLRFPSVAGAPAAGSVQIIEYFMPIEFSLTSSGTSVSTNLDHSAGLLQYATTGCPAGYSGCLTGVSDTAAPTLNRTCAPVATGSLSGTTLTWGTCPLAPPPPCLGTGCTPTTAQLNWTGANAQDSAMSPGCLTNLNTWGGVWCTSGLFCGAVPGTGAPSNETWDQHLPNLTFSSTSYGATGTTITLTESIVPDGYTDVYSGSEVITATAVHTECGAVAALTCNEQ